MPKTYPQEPNGSLVRNVFQNYGADVRHGLEFSAPTKASCENEVKTFLAALVHLTKPDLVVEFGVAEGYTLLEFGKALHVNAQDETAKSNNRIGKVIGVDLNKPELAFPPELPIEFQQKDFHDFHTKTQVDLAFLDATLDKKDEEFLTIAKYLRRGAIVVLHNVGMGRGIPVRSDIPKRGEVAFRRVPQEMYTRINFRTPAGLGVIEFLGL